MLIFLCPTFLWLPSAHPITRQLSSFRPPTQSHRRKDNCENPAIAPDFIRYYHSQRIAYSLQQVASHVRICLCFLNVMKQKMPNRGANKDQMAVFSQ